MQKGSVSASGTGYTVEWLGVRHYIFHRRNISIGIPLKLYREVVQGTEVERSDS